MSITDAPTDQHKEAGPKVRLRVLRNPRYHRPPLGSNLYALDDDDNLYVGDGMTPYETMAWSRFPKSRAPKQLATYEIETEIEVGLQPRRSESRG